MTKIKRVLSAVLLFTFCIFAASCQEIKTTDTNKSSERSVIAGSYTIDTVPAFTDKAYVEINNNVPYFTQSEYTTQAFENYSELDKLGRCGTAYACVCTETMPTEKRTSIGQVKPTGWQTEKYDIVDGKYLYNRCHLIGFQLTGENANNKNLITGTRYLNVDGMLPFENMVADYVKETKNHVLYRVTPVFDNDNLVARGVEMEAFSVEDNGDGISFNIYAYNEQPGIIIDYATGESRLKNAEASVSKTSYILNTKSKKYHLPTCSLAKNMSGDNKKEFTGTEEELKADGYSPCGKCISNS